MVIAGWIEPRQAMMNAVDCGLHRSIAEIGRSKTRRHSWESQAASSEIRARFSTPMQWSAKALINDSLM